MAIGTISDNGTSRTVELMASVTAANGVPGAATAGLELNQVRRENGSFPAEVDVVLVSTAGSGTMTVTARIWEYVAGANVWVPKGTGTASGKGVINAGAAIEETGADLLRHSEPLTNPTTAARLYLEVTAIGGTSTAVTGFLKFRR